jgi:serine/alanine adding enzyme
VNTVTQLETLRVARADRDDPAWDVFVRDAPESSFCHLSGWRAIVEDVLGREYIPLVAVTPDGEWRGVLPLVRVRARFFAHSLISMPYLNYGGPVGSEQAARLLVDAAFREALNSRARTLQIRCRAPLAGPAGPSMLAPLATPPRKVMRLLQLPAEPEELWHRFPSKVRSQIRRPQKEGMEFRTGPDQLDTFYEVFARNMRDLGTPVYSRRFFEVMAATFPELVLGAVYHAGCPVGAGAGFVWRGEFEMTWASCIREYNPLSPNMLLYWGFMRSMIERGVGTFNFGRSTPGASTHRFKAQWGGTDVPLPWIEWGARRNGSADGPSGLMRLASSGWRRMPLPVANLLGPPLASRLPWW